MRDKIFINYRHDDSQGHALHLREYLGRRLGFDRIFWDVDSMNPGDLFPEEIRKTIGECAAMIAVIGKRWLDRDDQGRPRILMADDWVRIELATALELDVHVIPVLVDGAKMPTERDVPSELKDLLERQAIELTGAFWKEGTKRLVRSIRGIDRVKLQPEQPPQPEDEDDGRIIAKLRSMRDAQKLDDIALFFRALTSKKDQLETRARQIIRVVGWQTISATVENQVRSMQPAAIGDVLTGIEVLETQQETLDLLRSLIDLLSGELRNRAMLIRARKRRVLEKETLSKLFDEHYSPYELVGVLGEGVFTTTYEARERLSKLPVVIRVLHQRYAQDDAVRPAFMDMVKRSLAYVHENLALTRAPGQFARQGIYFCVRDYIADSKTLQRELNDGRRFDQIEVLEVIRKVIAALSVVHRNGGVHGGVKPSNIFVGVGMDVRLGDPGLPISLAPPSLERLAYDYRYVAPECFKLSARVDGRADMYALGCIAYEMLSGRAPFVSDDPNELSMLHQYGAIAPGGSADPILSGATGSLWPRCNAIRPNARQTFARSSELSS